MSAPTVLHKHAFATRLLHAGLALAVILQLLTSLPMEPPEPDRVGNWYFQVHQYSGLLAFAFVFAFWVVPGHPIERNGAGCAVPLVLGRPPACLAYRHQNPFRRLALAKAASLRSARGAAVCSTWSRGIADVGHGGQRDDLLFHQQRRPGCRGNCRRRDVRAPNAGQPRLGLSGRPCRPGPCPSLRARHLPRRNVVPRPRRGRAGKGVIGAEGTIGTDSDCAVALSAPVRFFLRG
jgi:hypothetical protein